MEIKEILAKVTLKEDGTLEESFVAELEEYIDAAVELKVQDRAVSMVREATEPVIAEAKETLIQEYESKFEEYKDMITSDLSNFIDKILEEEMEIPAQIVEWAAKGQKYADIIDQLKLRIAIDENTVNAEVTEIMSEAKAEIENLRAALNEKTAAELEMMRDNEELAASLYIRTKCDGLTESQKLRAIPLLEGLKDKAVIDEKFEFIQNTLFAVNEEEKPLGAGKTETQKEVENMCVCPECGKTLSVGETSCDLIKCPDCEDVYLVDADKVEEVKAEIAKKKAEEGEKTKNIDESASVVNNRKALMDMFAKLV